MSTDFVSRVRWRVSPVGLACGLVLLTSCADRGRALTEVSGTVVMDGIPIDSGQILFRRTDGEQKGYEGAIKGGAYDYVTKPFDVDEILALVRQAAERRVLEREVHCLRAELDRAHGFDSLIGRHPSMVRLYELIAQVAQTPATAAEPRHRA